MLSVFNNLDELQQDKYMSYNYRNVTPIIPSFDVANDTLKVDKKPLNVKYNTIQGTTEERIKLVKKCLA